MEELLTIYEWPEKLLNKVKKLVLQQKSKNYIILKDIFGNLKCQNCRDFILYLHIYKTTHLILVDVWFCITDNNVRLLPTKKSINALLL